MTKIEKKDLSKYFYLFADCVISKGFTRTLITDTSRKSLYFIDNTYYEVLILCRDYSIGEISLMLEEEEDISRFNSFLIDLIEKGLGLLVDDIRAFPEIEKIWDHPSVITNGIIDIRETIHDFGKLFKEFDSLGCEFIEIRSYEERSTEDIEEIISKSINRKLKYLHFVTKFSEAYLAPNALKKITDDYPFVYISVYNSPKDKLEVLRSFTKGHQISFLHQNIDSNQCCGSISIDTFQIPSIKGLTENLLYNGCLNRKMSVDENGLIKNCPSMQKSYGNIKEDSLIAALNDDFRSSWAINKELINECSDCEYRTICTDCRAFIKDINNLYSKPGKCKYDPYRGEWAD